MKSNGELTEAEITLSVSIMAHPKRKAMVEDLLNRLIFRQNQLLLATVVWDRRNDEWDTAQRAWQVGMSSGASHHLVIQDDVLPCVDMIEGARDAYRYLPDNALMSLYLGEAKLGDGRATPRHQNVTRAIQRFDKQTAELAGNGHGWFITSGPWWGPAIAMPTKWIPEMLDFCIGRHEVYDRRLTIWCVSSDRCCWHPFPSFAEHKDEPSLVLPDRPRVQRVARRFLGENVSALTFQPKVTVRCR